MRPSLLASPWQRRSADGRSICERTLRGAAPTAQMLLGGVGSVVRARRAWLGAFAAGAN